MHSSGHQNYVQLLKESLFSEGTREHIRQTFHQEETIMEVDYPNIFNLHTYLAENFV